MKTRTPPRQNNIPTQKKRRNTKKKYNSRKPGRRSKGHKGVLHSHKSTETVHHTPKRCKGCGSANIKITKSKQVTDFKSMPELITTTPVSNTCIQFCFLIQADPTIPKRKDKRNHQAERVVILALCAKSHLTPCCTNRNRWYS